MSLSLLFTIFLAFAVLLILLVYRKPRKTLPYTGGETIAPTKIIHMNFYQTFYKFFPRTYRWLERLHNEDLDDYLYIILLATALLLLVAMLPGWF